MILIDENHLAFLNLPGWRWARIKQLALVGSSSSLHSEVCKALGGSSGIVHSKISVSSTSRSRGANRATLAAGDNLTVRKYFNVWCGSSETYLLGLLAQIKCSICSYQYDN